MARTRAYRRSQNKRVIDRKKKIIRAYAEDSMPAMYDAKTNPLDIAKKETWIGISKYGSFFGYWNYKHEGMLRKGKIHCSCGMCSYHDTPRQDIRKFNSFESQLDDISDEYYVKPLKNKLHKTMYDKNYPNTGGYTQPVSSAGRENITEFYVEDLLHKEEEINIRNLYAEDDEIEIFSEEKWLKEHGVHPDDIKSLIEKIEDDRSDYRKHFFSKRLRKLYQRVA